MDIMRVVKWLSEPTVIGSRKLAQVLDPGNEKPVRPDNHRYKKRALRIKPPWRIGVSLIKEEYIS